MVTNDLIPLQIVVNFPTAQAPRAPVDALAPRSWDTIRDEWTAVSGNRFPGSSCGCEAPAGPRGCACWTPATATCIAAAWTVTSACPDIFDASRCRPSPWSSSRTATTRCRLAGLDAGQAVIDLLKHGVSTDSIWEGLFATAAELVLRRPTVVPVHTQTSANAFHYAFRHARAETTQLLALLQLAAFMPAFRRGVGNTRADLRIDGLEPLAVSGNGAEALRDAFSELPHDRISGVRKALHYLQHGGGADRFVAGARRQLARNCQHSHDYKFTEATLENYRETCLSVTLRPRRGSVAKSGWLVTCLRDLERGVEA